MRFVEAASKKEENTLEWGTLWPRWLSVEDLKLYERMKTGLESIGIGTETSTEINHFLLEVGVEGSHDEETY